MTKVLRQGKNIQIFQPGWPLMLKHLKIIISKVRTLYFKRFDNSELKKQQTYAQEASGRTLFGKLLSIKRVKN